MSKDNSGILYWHNQGIFCDFAEKHYSWKMNKCKKPLWLLDFGFEGQKRLLLYWGAGHSSSPKEIMSKDQKKYCRQVSQKNQSHHWSNQIRYKRNSTSEILREQKLQIPHCKIEMVLNIIYLIYLTIILGKIKLINQINLKKKIQCHK